MFFFKDNKDNDNVENKAGIQKEFLAEMSYKIRNPLNSICGITEILSKTVDEGAYENQIRMYIDILEESAKELQEVVDECFAQYENTVKSEEEKSNLANDKSVLKNLRVMSVDDSEVNQMIVKELLEAHGAIVTLCSNGKEAVENFTKSITGTYDVILMDIKMPVMDGYEATDIIRNCDHPQSKSLPIVAMTAEAFAEDIEMALRSGMNAHISKPLSLDKIVAAIKGIKGASRDI